jgi:putative inorganic carbon (HCO3(-)) transporter
MIQDPERLLAESFVVSSFREALADLFTWIGDSGAARLAQRVAAAVRRSALLRLLFDRPFGPSPLSESALVQAAGRHLRGEVADPSRLTFYGLLYLILFVPVELALTNHLPSAIKYTSDAVLALLLLFLGSGVLDRRWAFRATPVDLPVLVLGAIGLLSGFVMDVPLKILILGLRAYLEYYVVYLVAVAAPIGDDDRRRLVWVFVGWAVLLAFIGSLQKILGVATPHTWVEASEGITTRVFGTMDNPNTFAGYLVGALSLFVALLTGPNRRWQEVLLAVGAVLGTFALLFTYSREGLFAFAAAMAVVGVLLDARILVVVVILAALALIADPKIAERIAFGFSQNYVNVSLTGGRLYYWTHGLQLAAHHPLLGVGPGRFGGSVAKLYPSPWYLLYGVAGMSSIDSEVIQVLCEMGILGLLAYLWILVTMVRQAVQVVRRDPDPFWRRVAAGSAAATVGFFIQSIFASLFEVHQVVLGLWLLAGLTGWRHLRDGRD